MLDYRVITKEDYRKIRLNKVRLNLSNKTNEEIDKAWDKLRKGYDFVIAVGKEDEPMLYSVEYFNEYMLQGKSKSNALTIKLNLDTTEFEEGLSRIEKRLQRVKESCDVIKSIETFDKSLNEVKNITINMVESLK